jgi:hypothetical protein
LPRLQQLFDKYKAQHFDVITINILRDEDKGAVQVMSNTGFTALKNPGQSWSWAEKTYGVDETPTSFLLDANGKVLFKFNDVESRDDVRRCDAEVGGLLAFEEASNATSARAAVKAQP